MIRTTITTVRQRRGGVSLGALIALPALLLLAGLVFYIGTLREARIEDQSGADAAALAAANALVGDGILVVDRTLSGASALQRTEFARVAAHRLAHANFAEGQRLQLNPNPTNAPDGDIVFGHLDHPQGGTFTPVPTGLFPTDPTDPDQQPTPAAVAAWAGTRLNAVRVTTRRPPVKAPFGGKTNNREVLGQAVAILDFQVVGFHPLTDEPLPLMPIGLLTDHLGEVPNGWDACARNGLDEWRFDSSTQKFVPGSDGIPEVRVVLGRQSQNRAVPGVFLQIGITSFTDLVGQIRTGIARPQLVTDFGGRLVLGPDNMLLVPGTPDCPTGVNASRQSLDDALKQLRDAGLPRVWQLVSGGDENTGAVQVTGWVAARVVSVGPSETGGIALVLQPTVLHHPAVVTENRSPAPVFWANNQTVCRVRLAE